MEVLLLLENGKEIPKGERNNVMDAIKILIKTMIRNKIPTFNYDPDFWPFKIDVCNTGNNKFKATITPDYYLEVEREVIL